MTGAGEPPARIHGADLVIVVSGVLISLQVYLNGRLAGRLGSAELAGSVNNLSGLVALLLFGIALGAPRRAVHRLTTVAPRLRLWHLTMGANGALFTTVAAYAAPRLGVALLTVAIVFGQASGSLVIDQLGLSPAGVRRATPRRLAGVGLAVVAVALSALETSGAAHPELLALAALGGAGAALQHAAMGHTARATGEPVLAAALNMAAGAAAVLVLLLLTTGLTPPHGWSAAPAEWVGGLLGAGAALLISGLVGRLGVVRVMLAMVGGQAAAGIVLDVVAAPPGHVVGVVTVASVLLTLTAVVVGADPGAPRPAVAAVTQPRPSCS